MSDEVLKLRRVIRYDNIPVNETYYTEEGFLIDHPVVTKVGIFEYMNADGTIRRELRLPEEVFKPESLKSYEGKPIIITHNAGVITNKNVEDEIIGTMLSEGYKDGENVRVKIVIHDTDAMKRSGLRELSLGYNLTLDETPGEYNGHPYDAIQRNIEINHLALVAAARAGENARLNIDGKDILIGGPVMSKRTDGVLTDVELQQAIDDFLKKKSSAAPVTQDEDNTQTGESQNVATENNVPEVKAETVDEEDVVQSVRDRRDRRDAETASNSKETALEVIQQQDTDIDTLLQIIEKLKAQNDFNSANSDGVGCSAKDCGLNNDGDQGKSENLNLDSAAVDRIVAEKLSVIRVADSLNMDGLEDLPIIEAKKKIIEKVYPKIRLDGKNDVYVDAMFDLTKDKIREDGGTNAQRRQLFNADSVRPAQPVSAAEQARAKMIERQTNNGGNK